MRTGIGSGAFEWPQTDWSALRRAGGEEAQRKEILSQLVQQYRVPMLEYLNCAFPSLRTQNDELLLDFAQDRLLREEWLNKADRGRGRFRDLLKRSLKNYVRDYLRKEAHSPASLEELELEPAAEEDGAEAFDLSWARMVLNETLSRMERDCRAPGKEQPHRAQIWDVFRLRILGPTLEGLEAVGYEELVRRFGISSPFEAHNMLATAKRIFTRHLEAVIRDYEHQGASVKAEIEELRKFLEHMSGERRN